MRYSLLVVLAVCLSAVALSPSPGADWPGWRGPDRTSISPEKGLLATWPEAGPKLLWTSDKAGRGFAGLAVVGDQVYTMGARDKEEYVIALDDKGGELWATKIGPVHDWKTNQWSYGPNATPTVDGDLVFGLSSKGDLICVKKADGAKVWSKNLPAALTAEIDNTASGGIAKFGWGFCWSPLVDGDKLVITPGGPKGLFAALDKKTGNLLWQSKAVTDPATYSTAAIATIGGVKQYIYLTQHGVVAVAAADGSLLWQWKREQPYPDVVCPTPIVHDDLVYATAREGGSALLKITAADKKFTAEPVYTEKTIGNHQGGVVLLGKYVYGFHEERNWACQDFATGEVAWPKKRSKQDLKAGAVLAADGRLYVVDEEGTVAMLDASPKGYKVLSSFTLPQQSKQRKISGKVWTHPSLSDGKLYLRDQELVFCYQVK